jgi:hypothetical protein
LAAHSDILMIGMSGYPAHDGSFLSQRNIYEYKTIVWNVPTLATELAAGMTSKNAEGAQRLFQASMMRLNTLNEWVIAGLVLIALQPFAVPGYGMSYPFQAPLDRIDFTPAEGTRIEACGNSEVNDLLRPQIPAMHYSTVLSGAEFAPFLKVIQGSKGNPQFVGGYRQQGSGLVIYLPEVNWKKGNELSFVQTVRTLPSILKPAPAKLPAWVHQYRTSSESRLHSEIAAEEALIAEGQSRIVSRLQIIDGYDRLKQLFVATGTPLEEVVAEALRELGLAVVVGPNSRADLLASDGHRFAAIEAKGLEGPCREAHLREVGVWTAEVDLAVSMPPEERGLDQKAYWETLKKLPSCEGDEACKGILVANTFRTLPLSERTEPDFPDAMQRKISPMGICALTGLQLFGLVMEARLNPEARKDIVRALFETQGVLKRGGDWSAHLVKAGNT